MFVEIRFLAIQHTIFFDFPIVFDRVISVTFSTSLFAVRYSLLDICFLENDFSLVE